MKALGLLLVVAGLLGLVYGGISWTREKTIIDAGPIAVNADERESVVIPPLIGVVLIIAGVALTMRK